MPTTPVTPGRLRLGLNLGYWGQGGDAENLALAKEADRLGYDSAWAAEAYGSDAVTILTWVAAQTERIDVGSAVLQIPARTPAMTAMTAATLDSLSGGRFRLGLGVSGPQVSEGWHGVRFGKPLGRTREYLDVVRMALRRETVRYEGEHFTLPLPDGPGKAIADRAPGARAHPGLPGRGRPEEPRASPARWRTAGSRSSSAPSTPPCRWTRCGAGGLRPGWRWTTSTSCPPCPS
ncbi:hypothetical protein GCM10025868_00680 [Angustibacter aerolatus]|uniref:Luciferase-like domain-containing protein n=1 Tax=Angustibacter aerolatus TaxID=1162965 RepID=A0ABQ6J9J2_9ACTN|nr:LLM class flavin-dependent oxidoreductase [Angustibacter aerolatus]GMA84818.1 hypothetical protein GCM10025868_00680 [Angustibacter aerolatus]